MSITQLISLLILVGGLAIFTIQNLSPSLSLMFLGNQLPTLPLSVWILIAIASGILTYLIIHNLFKIDHHQVKPFSPSKSSSETVAKPPLDPVNQSSWGYTPEPVEPTPEQVYTASGSVSSSEPEPRRSRFADDDDWETEVQPFDPAWETEGRNTGEKPAQTATESDSSYAYSYEDRDSSSTGVGKVETVYDADYRIITPPPKTKIQDDIKPQSYNNYDQEDWGLEDEEDRSNLR
ncbi:LapA family protein [Planktothrix paucivesiculata]|uniref:Lipopolysaccharide assembly protein A domain-containing protein n=1 Tax=Planktothrix paucivesiculata PCC 9631 TaxID=671071 RepID=A0A7Z9DXV7_9CYAN|nr:hypothetical protein [Planktothrix paucivesiculata]VXD11973.1 conserved hypothetical protein [Planktothrix paucivesiculata PCC 9631]